MDNKSIFLFKPQINISYSSTGRMWLVFFCAFLCVLQSALNDGGLSFVIAGTALFFAILTELLLTGKAYGISKIKDGSAATTAMILTLMLPNQIHPVYAALGVVFAIVVVKYSFGGLGTNWLNPALGGWLFIKFSWPNAFTNALAGINSSVYEIDGTVDISSVDSSITEFLNSSIFSVTGMQLPFGYIDLLVNNDSGIIADRGILFLLIGTIFITATAINRGWIPLVFLAVYGFLVRFAGDFAQGAGILWNGDLLYGIFSGGTLLAAFILTAEPSTSAKLRPGVLLTVILSAAFSWFFRYTGGEYFGAFIAIALVNCFTPLIKLTEEKLFLFYKETNHKTREKTL